MARKPFVETPSPSVAVLLLLTGAAAGALTAWAMTAAGREKLASLGVRKLLPEDTLQRATDLLVKARNKVVDAVDATTKKL